MKNLFKKLLACCLAVCMVLTLCVGAITVGAEAAGYLTVGTVDITTDDKAAEVPVTIFSTAGIAAAEINVRVPENLSIAKLELVTEDKNVEVTFASAADPSGAPELLDSKVATSDVAPNVIDGVFTYIVHLPAGKVATTQVNVLITFAGAFAEGKIPVTADVEACKDATSDLLTLDVTDGAINVAAAHVCAPATTVEENRVEATCYAEGSYDEVVKCSCGKELSRTAKTIEKIAHTPAEAVVENNKAATCYAKGSYESVVYCSVEACKAEISRTTVPVDETEHTPATAVVENEVAATCLAAGSYESVVYCSVAECKHEISRTTIPTAKLEHVFGDNLEFCANNCGTANPDYVAPHVHNYTYEYDAEKHTQICKNEDGLCDAVTSEAVAHEFDETTGLCVCGLKLDKNLVISRISFSFSDSALVCNYRFRNKGLLDLYEDVAFAVTPNKYDKETMNLVKNPTTYVIHEKDYTAAGTQFMEYKFSDFYLYELALNVDYKFYAYENDKLVAISPNYSMSTVEEIKNTVIGTTDAAEKKAYTDLLIVCDEYMKATGDSKPGSDLDKTPSILDGFDTSAKTVSVDKWETTEEFISYNDDFAMVSTAAHEVRCSVEAAKVPFFNLRIMDKKSNLDISKLSVTVSYTSVDKKGEHPKTFVYDSPEMFNDQARFDELKFDLVGLHDSNKVIKFAVSYDGEAIFDYYRSVEQYTGANKDATDGTAGCMTALLHFGQSFRAYMGI